MSSNLVKILCRTSLKGFLTRSMGTLSSLEIDKTNKIAVLTLMNPPANTLSLEMLKDLNSKLEKLEGHNKPKGLILSSNLKSIFSAGLDLHEVRNYRNDDEHLTKLWTELQNVCMKLYSSDYPTVAAICGHAIAGGCALAFACEHRIMVQNYQIGLNETKVGLHVPKWLIAYTKNILPKRLTEAAILEGKLFNTMEAYKYGLIDEIAKDSNNALKKSEEYLNKINNFSQEARNLTKKSFRLDDIEEFEKICKKDLETFLFFVKDSKFQDNLGKYLEKLKVKN